MDTAEKVLYTDDRFQIVDMIYAGRPARVLFTNDHTAAQSGIARDARPELLFDYNQRFLEVAESVQPHRVLLIGGGAYTWPQAALRNFPHVHIDVVEPDVSLDAIAARFFEFKPDERLHITHQDGATFLETNKDVYDLIIIDAFNGIAVPESITAEKAIVEMRRHLNDNGTVAMNIVSPYWGRGGESLRRCFDRFRSVFECAAIYPADSKYSLWQSQNFVLVARRGATALPTLRFAAVPPDY